MDPRDVDTFTAIVVAVAAVAAWAGLYGLLRLLPRPAAVAEPPASPELPEHPPALVNLIANRWRLNEDAAEATLLDLAARGFFEIRQPEDDPAHSTLHPREPRQPQTLQPQTLQPYEQRVLDRVRRAAVGGVVP